MSIKSVRESIVTRGARPAIVCFILLMVGCISTSDMMNSWLGIKEPALVAEWGEPDKIVSAGASGKIFVYIETDSYSSRGGNDSNIYGSGSIGSDIPGPETRWKRTYMFWLNDKGVVYDWKLRKEEIPYSALDAEVRLKSH